MKKWRVWLGLIIMIMIAAGLAGCSASDSNSGSKMDAPMESASSEESAANSGGAATESQAGEAAADSSAATADSDAGAASGTAAEGGSEGGGVIGNIADDAGFNRKLIYRANLAMQVDDYGKAQSKISNAITLSGGYIMQFSDQMTSYENGGTYTIKVPAKGFMSFIAGLEKIEHLSLEKKLEGTDVTEEYVDLESRLKARQVVEARLLGFMEKAAKADDLLKFSQELGNVQTEIERIKGRMRYLDQNVAYSTVELRVYQAIAPVEIQEEKRGFAKQLSDAWNGSLSFIANTAQGIVIVLAAIVPVLVVLLVIGLPFYMLYGRRKMAAARVRQTQARADEALYNQSSAQVQTNDSAAADSEEQGESKS